MSTAQPTSLERGNRGSCEDVSEHGVWEGSCMTPLGSMHYTTIPSQVSLLLQVNITPEQAIELLGYDPTEE